MSIENEYCEAFESAEKHLKNAETYVGQISGNVDSYDFFAGLLLPATNELRYAGYHAAKASKYDFDADDNTVANNKKTEYEKAIKHCHRACFDAIDAQMQYAISECRQFQEDYRTVVISGIIKNYQDDIAQLDQFQAQMREQGEKEDRWKMMELILPKLLEIQKRWNFGRDELNKMLEEKRNARFNQVIVLILMLFGILITLIIG
ncbi:MAG: hypothetical protein ACRCUY_09770 [Thermoguttaceae bacterium]